MENEMMVQNHELAASASAAQARAEIECAYTMAIRRPRNIDDVRTKILSACKRPVFAVSAEYAKPIGGGSVRGPSIRFAETALQCLGNVRTATSVVYEDDKIRKIRVSVVDLENNNAYGLETTIQKTVERKNPKKGQTILNERVNSQGEKIFLVEASEDELTTKQGAAASKMIRNCGLRLLPQDIIEEAMEAARNTRKANAADPKAATNQIVDAFAGLGVKPSELEQYLGKPIAQVVANDIENLRLIYTAIKAGESNWSDYLETVDTKPETIAEKLARKNAEKPPAGHQVKSSFDGINPEHLKQARAQLGIDTPEVGLSPEQVEKIIVTAKEIEGKDF